MNKLKNKLFTPPLTTSAQKEIKTSEVSLIGVGNIVGGVLVLIGVAVLLVAVGLFFFGLLLVFIRDFLAGRRTTRSMSGAAGLAAMLAGKRNKGSWLLSSIGGIGGIPLSKWVIKLRELMIWLCGKPNMPLKLKNIISILIYLPSNILAHAKDTKESPLDE